jgi:AcrR family transcriptional regulator
MRHCGSGQSECCRQWHLVGMYNAPAASDRDRSSCLNVAIVHSKQPAILTAAAACIMRIGLDKTSMDDVAAQAGVSRRTLYRAFGSKEQLFATLFETHVYATTFNKARRRATGRDFETAFVEGALAGIGLIRSDPLTMEIMYRSGGPWFQRQMLDTKSPMFRAIMRIQLNFWTDMLDRARAQGLLNDALSNAQILEWYTMAQYILVLRVDRSVAEQRFIIRNLLIPSFLRRPDAQGAVRDCKARSRTKRS